MRYLKEKLNNLWCCYAFFLATILIVSVCIPLLLNSAISQGIGGLFLNVGIFVMLIAQMYACFYAASKHLKVIASLFIGGLFGFCAVLMTSNVFLLVSIEGDPFSGDAGYLVGIQFLSSFFTFFICCLIFYLAVKFRNKKK